MIHKFKDISVQGAILLAVVVICVTVLMALEILDVRTAAEIVGGLVALGGGVEIGRKNPKPANK